MIDLNFFQPDSEEDAPELLSIGFLSAEGELALDSVLPEFPQGPAPEQTALATLQVELLGLQMQQLALDHCTDAAGIAQREALQLQIEQLQSEIDELTDTPS